MSRIKRVLIGIPVLFVAVLAASFAVAGIGWIAGFKIDAIQVCAVIHLGLLAWVMFTLAIAIITDDK